MTEALKGTDLAAIKSAAETLATESQQLGSALYAQQQSDAGSGASAGAAGGATSGAPDEEIVDAEIVDDEKK